MDMLHIELLDKVFINFNQKLLIKIIFNYVLYTIKYSFVFINDLNCLYSSLLAKSKNVSLLL
jgi:hypothetical protein